MAKPTNKRAAAAAAAAGKPSWVRKHLGFVLVAIGVQLFLTIGYLSWPEAPAQEAASARGAAEPLGAGPPAVCPDDWDECPRVAGVDWPALFARERAPETQPTTEALAKCEAHGLLSPLTVPGMHLVCVLPPPPAAAATRPGAEASATLAIFDQMLSSSAPSRILLLPANLRTGEHAVAAVQRAIGFARPAQTKWGEYQPAALFTDRGVRVATVRLGRARCPTPPSPGGSAPFPPMQRPPEPLLRRPLRLSSCASAELPLPPSNGLRTRTQPVRHSIPCTRSREALDLRAPIAFAPHVSLLVLAPLRGCNPPAPPPPARCVSWSRRWRACCSRCARPVREAPEP